MSVKDEDGMDADESMIEPGEELELWRRHLKMTGGQLQGREEAATSLILLKCRKKLICLRVEE